MNADSQFRLCKWLRSDYAGGSVLSLAGAWPARIQIFCMALIVQKYGGTSVGNTDRIKNVAARVAKYQARGDQMVVVVSAMSGVTDGLIKLAKEITPLPSEREMDMLLATGEQQTIALTAIALDTHRCARGVDDRRAGGHYDRLAFTPRPRSTTSRPGRCMKN